MNKVLGFGKSAVLLILATAAAEVIEKPTLLALQPTPEFANWR